MKCVKNANEVRRLSDEKAEELVKNKGWEFTTKTTWKNTPSTTWTKASTPPNPMSASKVRRKEMKNRMV